jgi:hypothetical protein
VALDTYSKIWGGVLLRCPLAGSFLAREWVSHAFRRLAERRRWSWLMKRGQFLSPAVYSTGTVTVVRESATVTGAATVWTAAMVDRQFKIGSNPIYTIISVNVGAQTLVLDQVWGGASAAGSVYEIYKCLFPVPTDFHSFVSVYDSKMNWQLHLNYAQAELNTWDSQRASRGQSWVVAPFDYYTPSGYTIPVQRVELWPHQTAEYVYSMLYEARPTDLQDSGATLPRFIHGDLLLEMSLAEAARWPGPSEDRKNPYFNIQLAAMHDKRAEFLIMEAERQDDAAFEQDVSYLTPTGYPFVPFLDSAWLQSHHVF